MIPPVNAQEPSHEHHRRQIVIAGVGDTGMRIARRLVASGDQVIALRRRPMVDLPGIRHLAVDLTTGEGFTNLSTNADILVYCVAPDRRDEQTYRSLYVHGLQRILSAIEFQRVLFISSTAVYSEDRGGWVDEDSPADAQAFNARVLREAEQVTLSHGKGMVLRLSGIYGPGRERMIRLAAQNDSIKDSPRWTNRIHVDDAAAAAVQLLSQKHDQNQQKIYCGNDDCPVLDIDVIDWLRVQLGLSVIDRTSQISNQAPIISGKRVANTRLRAIGWRPQYPDYRAGYLHLLNTRGV